MSPRATGSTDASPARGSLPASIALLIGATLVASILGAQVASVGAMGALVPAQVFAGQLWRLVTWAFFEPDPLGLIFAAWRSTGSAASWCESGGPCGSSRPTWDSPRRGSRDLRRRAGLARAASATVRRGLAGRVGPDHRLGDRVPDPEHAALLRCAAAAAAT